jgi:hypothetical protein
MRGSFAVHSRLRLARSPNLREEAVRRLLLVVCAIAALALASGVIGSLSAPVPPFPLTGPFSYFPSQ